jgi:predicted nucleotidyltransferase
MDYATAVSAIREAIPGTIAVYLFGSRARGDAGGESDVDLAVLGTEPLGPLVRFEVQERIAAELHASVDLVDLRSASAVLRVQVLEHGELLYESDPRERARFEVAALSAYARLNEERKGILEEVGRTGRVHG